MKTTTTKTNTLLFSWFAGWFALFVLLLSGLSTNAQVYLPREGFESAFTGSPAAPPGWTQQLIRNVNVTSTSERDWVRNQYVSGSTWTIDGFGTEPNAVAPGSLVGELGALYIDDGNFNAAGNQIRRVISPVVNLSASTNPHIRFQYHYANANGVLNFRVMASNDGTNWTLISTPVGIGAVNAWRGINVFVPAAFRTSTARFALDVTATFGSNGVFVDNFIIEEFTPTVITYTGASGGNWFVTTNWSLGVIPTADHTVVIPAATVVNINTSPAPAVTSAVAYNLNVNGTLQFSTTANVLQVFNDLTVGSTGTYISGSATVGTVTHVGRNVTVNAGGTLNFANGTSNAARLVFNGGSPATYTNNGTLANTRISNISFANGGGVSFASAVAVRPGATFTTSNVQLVAGAVDGTNLTLGNSGSASNTQLLEVLDGTFSVAPTYDATNVTARNLSYLATSGTPTFRTFRQGYVQTAGLEFPATLPGTLVLNTHNNISITSNRQVNATITFTRGLLLTGTNEFIVGAGASPGAGTSSSVSTLAIPTTHGSYVVGNIRYISPASGTGTRNVPLGVGSSLYTGSALDNRLVLSSVNPGTGGWASQEFVISTFSAATGSPSAPIQTLFGNVGVRFQEVVGTLPSTFAFTWRANRWLGSTPANDDNNSDQLTVGDRSNLAVVQSTTPTGGTWTRRSLLLSAGDASNSFSTGAFADNTEYTGQTAVTGAAPGPITPFSTNGQYFILGSTASSGLAVGTVSAINTPTTGMSWGAPDQPILRVDIPVSGLVGAQTLNGLTVNYTGTNLSDISGSPTAVKLWRTTGTTFTSPTLLQSQAAASTVNFTTIGANLPVGTNYFWITIDVSTTPTPANVVDFEVPALGLTINESGGAQAYAGNALLAPTGSRSINAASPYNITLTTGVPFTSIMSTGSTFASWLNGGFNITDEGISEAITLPFPFTYFGTSVTQIRAYVNGFLNLDGGSATNASSFSPRVSSTNIAGRRAIVSPFWDDLTTFVDDNNISTLDASIRYQTVGNAPNRRFIVEWANMTKFVAPGPDLNFQVVLHENGNRIEFIYGNMTGFNGTGNVSWSYQTGINSFSTATHTPASLQKLEVPDVQQFGTSTTNLTKVPDCYISYLFDPASNYLSGPGAPALPNDECASGINLGTPLIEAPSELCDVYYSAGATASSGIPVCSAPTPGTPDDDVWFTFTTDAVGTADYAVTVYPSNVYDAAVQVFSGTCGSLTPITCVNANGNGLTEIANLPGLAQNTTYRVRVYHAATGVGTSNGSFSIAVTRVFPAPANNECAGATVLTPGVTCSPTSGTTLGANTSVGIPVCSVAGTVADDDVFFTFTATQAIHEVRVQGLSTFNPVVQFFSGACGSLSAINCVNSTGAGGLETVSSNAFVIGQTYTIRVYHSGLGTASGNFTICVVSPPPPANDNCTGALLLANGSSCVNTSASGFGSTASAQAACGGNPDDDVWFRFVATNTYAEITVTGSTNYNPHIEVFNGGAGVGNCATMTSIACDDSDFGSTESTSLTGLTIGNSYFVRVYHTGTYVGTSSGNFQICVFTPPPPSNDNCNTSINVVPSTTTTCVSSVTSNVFLATASGPAGCDGTADDDIWFRFTADYPEAVINATTAYDCVIEFFVGNCFGLTSAVCEDFNFGGNETMFLTNLTVGETYYFRVYSWSSTPQTFSAGVTTVCITRPPPPSNDECAGAVSLTVGGSCVTTTGSGYGATQSLAPATCSGFTSTDAKDVWFTFNVTTPGVHNIEVQASGINTEPIVELFSGTCGTLSSISCSDATINGGREIISQNLSAGVHFVRVYNFGPAGASNFTICVNTATLPAPPVNDNPNNAIALTPVVSCGFDGPYSSTGATMTYQTSTASNDDVWFTFPAPSYSFQIRVQGSGGYDPVFRVFTFNELAPGIKTVSTTTTARDTSGVNGLERFTLFGYTTGEPVYVQVYAFGTGAPSGSFTICAQINPPPPNDDCANATLLTQNLGCTPTAGNTLEATDSGVTPPSCPGSPDDDVWYRFVATTTNPIIRVQGTNNFNAVVEFRGTGPCSGTSVTCVNNTGNNGVEQINLTGLTVGTTYYFRVYSAGSANSDQGTFTVCVRNAIPQGATCANPLVLAVNAAPVNFTGNSAGYDNDLGAQTSTCSSLYGTNGEDVVFQLNVGSPGQRIISVTNTSGTNNIGWFLKSNVNCATTSASLACAVSGTGPTAQAIFNFPSSGTYFLIVDYLTIVNSGFTLDIIPLPTNDDPCTATPVTFSTSTPTIISATNLGATNGTFGPGPGTCSLGSFSSDVWFRTTLPAGVTSIAVNTLPGSNSDVTAEMFTAAVNGDCNTAFTNIACNDDGGPGFMSWAAASNLTPGTVVFIRISSYGTAQGAFQFAVTQGQVWLGNVSNSWTAINSTGVTSDDNWFSRDVVPNSSTVVVIPNVVGAGGFPAITTTANVQSLIFARVGSNFSGANVTVNSGSLNFNAQASENSFIRSNTSVRSRINGPGFVNFLQTGNNTYDISNIVEFGGVVAARAGTTVNSGGNMVFINNSSLLSGNVNRDGFDATGNVTGNIRYQRTGSNVAGIYNYWSSPVSGAPISVLNNVGLGNNIYLYDNTRTGANTNVLAGWEGPITASSSPTNTSAAMIAGKGYIQTAAGNGSVTFTGAPRQTNATIGVTTNGGNNFNLVGNPYPSTLSLSQAGTNPTQYFFGVNTNVAGVYLWRNLNLPPFAGAGYVTMTQVGTSGATTPGGYTLPQIGAAQGFMVAVNAATAVNFNGEMRLTGIPGNNPQFLDVNDFSTARIRLYNAEETQSYETMLAFKDDATDGIDHQQDAQRFPVQLGLEVFTVNGDNQFVIQALPTLHTGRIIPLGTQMADANATYKIRLTEFANFDATTRVYIEDLATGAFHNLSANNTYEFVNMAWTGVRFKLHFRAPIAVSANGACAGEATGKLIVNNPNPTPASLTVKNAEGLIIAQENNWMGDKIVNNMTAGNYTINVAYEPTDVITRNAVIEAGSLNGAANFTASAYTVSLDDATVQFTGINNGANSITWDFGDGRSVSGVLNPVHTYTQAGQYTVTLTTMANGCGSSTSKVINVGASTVGIGSIANQNSFSIYPNPSSDIAYVLLNMAANEKDVMVSIIDNTGRLVSKERVNEVRNGSVVTLQVNGLANGIYEVVVENKNFRSVGKLSVAH